MTSLLRLKYQVDCVASDDNKVGPFAKTENSSFSLFFPFGQGEQQGCLCLVIDTGLHIAHHRSSIEIIRYLHACSDGQESIVGVSCGAHHPAWKGV
jgi:hypothetical protein